MKKQALSVFILFVFIASFAQAQTASPATPVAAKEDCGCEVKPLPEVVAIVNGVQIKIKDVDDPISRRIQELQKQVIDARKRELELQINSKLLEAEAKKRGTTTTKIIEQEIIAKTKEPTEAEAQAFYDKNKDRISGGFNDVKKDIIEYLKAERQRAEAAQFANRLRAASDVKVIVAETTPPANEAARARVFATVNGQPITSGDVEDSLRPLIFEAQEAIYNLRKQQLDLKVNDTLLEQEALKRKITTRALMEAEITPKVKPISEADAQKFFDENKNRLNGDFVQLKPQIIQYLQQQESRRAEGAFADQLRKVATIQLFLNKPEAPSYAIATDDQPAKGSPTALVTIVEFTDFQCPSCAKSQPVLDAVTAEFGDKVRLVVRDFPLEQHAFAFKAAEAAEAAREQGKYWEYIALLFQNQSALEVANLKAYATQVGLDRKRFDEALDSGKFADKVRRDLNDGIRVGVNSTPTVFINGRVLHDKSRESLKAAIEAAIKEKSGK
ncbi:MAG TPA: thioredoxin domain-containing protein [Blastocatellia bacterium]|nr:thioredoxin domain-containing protein [Blastocatellia bacterium]